MSMIHVRLPNGTTDTFRDGNDGNDNQYAVRWRYSYRVDEAETLTVERTTITGWPHCPTAQCDKKTRAVGIYWGQRWKTVWVEGE